MRDRIAVLAILVLLLVLSRTSSAAIIQITDAAGNQDIRIAPGQASTDIYFRILQEGTDPVNGSGNVDIAGAGLSLQVGDGGTAIGGVDTGPLITDLTVSATGTGSNASIWDPAPLLVGPPTAPFGTTLVNQVSTVALSTPNTNTQFGTALPGNVLGVWTLDTSALGLGDGDVAGTTNLSGDAAFALTAFPGAFPTSASANDGLGGINSLTFNTTSPFSVSTLSVSAVPEPGSIVLLTLGAVSLMGGRSLRRKKQQQTAA